ncbi:hypothetical protein NDU88_005128 [Pleurodeles waltl]|uniref:Uncharacterized protein n=1 Tax=Pleurodeles waltl TaxID=8319 RepID=A0AAV7VME7_PLEWA|nr:hypothetical protein NDU88_005128 [Pleurodeles waltl]
MPAGERRRPADLSAQEHNPNLIKALPWRGARVPGLGAERSTMQRHDRWGHTHRQALETVPVRGRRLVCCHDLLRGAHATSRKIDNTGMTPDWCCWSVQPQSEP